MYRNCKVEVELQYTDEGDEIVVAERVSDRSGHYGDRELWITAMFFVVERISDFDARNITQVIEKFVSLYLERHDEVEPMNDALIKCLEMIARETEPDKSSREMVKEYSANTVADYKSSN